jgi:hypothetical protein
MGPSAVAEGTAWVMCAAFAASEMLALFHPNREINSVTQYVRHACRRRWPWPALLAGCAVLITAGLLPQALARNELNAPAAAPCRVDDLANRSFAGMWRGRLAVIHIRKVTPAARGVAFDYSMRFGGDDLRGSGAIDVSSCDVTLSSFDSLARLVRDNRKIELRSVEPAWRLTAYVRRTESP